MTYLNWSLKGCVLGVFKTTLMIQLSAVIQWLSIHWHSAMIYYSESIRRKSTKWKGSWGKVWGKRDGSSQGFFFFFPQGRHTGPTYFPKQWVMTTHGKCCQLGSLLEAQSPASLLGLTTYTASACQLTKFQTPTGKAGVHHKPYCLYSGGTASTPPLSVLGMTGTLPRSKLPDSSLGPAL